MTKSKAKKKRAVEMKQTGFETLPGDWYQKHKKRRQLGERRARLRALREDVVIHPTDVKPGEIIEFRKVRPKKRRDRYPCKWRVHYDDSGNGYMILTQESYYNKKWADKNTKFYTEHGFSIKEVWNLSSALVEFLLPRLKVFIEIKRHSVPDSVCKQFPDDIDAAAEEWERILKDIYIALCMYHYDDEGMKMQHEMGNEAAHEAILKGMDLLQKYLFDLWD